MDFTLLFQSVEKTWHSLISGWLFKTILSLAIATVTSVHGSALIAFVALVFVDLFTRWMALTYKFLEECKKISDANLWDCIVNIPRAMDAGYINSDAMKHRFLGKIFVYVFFTIMAVSADGMLKAAGEIPLILKVVWVYLAATEAISVLENLRDSGVEQAGGLLIFVRDKLNNLLEKYKH